VLHARDVPIARAEGGYTTGALLLPTGTTREREQMGEGIQTTTTSECFCYCQQERRESESRWTREYKPQQRQNTSEDKALFEAASRARSLSINDARMILQVLLNTKGNNQRGSAESAVAAPPAIDS
jgi:hypothetical protein